MYTSSRFGTLFASQQYDAALAEYCRAFNALVLKRTDADISLDGLFRNRAGYARPHLRVPPVGRGDGCHQRQQRGVPGAP